MRTVLPGLVILCYVSISLLCELQPPKYISDSLHVGKIKVFITWPGFSCFYCGCLQCVMADMLKEEDLCFKKAYKA